MQLMSKQLTALLVQCTRSTANRIEASGLVNMSILYGIAELVSNKLHNLIAEDKVSYISQNCWRRQGNSQGRVYTYTSSREYLQFQLSAHTKECVTTIRNTCSIHIKCCCLIYIRGNIGNHSTSILLDSGMSCSVVCREYLQSMGTAHT